MLVGAGETCPKVMQVDFIRNVGTGKAYPKKFMRADFIRNVGAGETCPKKSCGRISSAPTKHWEGEAPAEPKISANREMGRSDKFGLTRRFALPLDCPPMNWWATFTKPAKAGYFFSRL